MAFKSFFVGFLLTLPWLTGAAPGPIPQLGAWLASAGALVVLWMSFQTGAWRWSLITAALVSAAIGLLQFTGGSAGFTLWVSESATGEMVANLRQRNQFATLMVIGGLAVLLDSGGRATYVARSWVFGVACLSLALLAFAAALSGSRTGLLQWLALLCLAVSWRNSLGAQLKWLFGVSLLGFCLGALAGPWLAQMAGHLHSGVMGRLVDMAGSPAVVASADGFSRLALWGNVLELIAHEPLWGHGWRSLARAHYSTEFSGTRFIELVDNAHNLPLHLAVELGVPVAVAACCLVGWLIWKNKPWAETRPDRQMAWGLLVVIGIHSMLEYPLWYGPFFLTALMCLFVLLGDFWRNWLARQSERAQSAIDSIAKLTGVMLLACTAFVAFDYHRVSQIYLQPQERSAWYAADPMAAANKSVLFQSHAKFAQLQITPLSRETAAQVFALSQELVRWSPEPRIVEKLIESATMLQRDDVAIFHLQRYKVAYPATYSKWAQRELSKASTVSAGGGHASR
jgi:hypothetical protein